MDRLISHSLVHCRLHSFALIAKDKDQRTSQTKSFFVDTVSNSLTTKDLLVPPTIDTQYGQVSRGGIATILGYASPNYTLNLYLDGILYKEALAGKDGSYKIEIPTGALDFGQHAVKIKQLDQAEKRESDFSTSRTFIVSKLTVVRADFNGDGGVDIKDWSIFLARWGSKDTTVRTGIDLNSEKVDIADFSIFIKTIRKNNMLRIPFAIILGVSAFCKHRTSKHPLSVPATGEYGVGKEISIDFKIDSDGVGLNAAQATIRFPKDTLTVKSIDKTGSTFNFWLEEPAFSNEDGVITFVGGTPYGVSGASLQVVHIVFTSKGSGSAPITITDAAVTASDGNGTNILSKTNGAVFTISPTATAPAIIVPAPKQITREVAPASGLPEKPTLTIPLYPDPATWYNLSNIFAVNFALPRNISEISTAINKQPNFTPTEESEGLFDSKTFAALSDGIWYLHVRFQNGIGWGATTHYRIAVDTHPPLPFAVTSDESI